jgi:glycosyltransferase involved in cell wall biosynthesis
VAGTALPRKRGDESSSERISRPSDVNAFAKSHPEMIVLRHDNNRGKGAAIRTGFARATGDFVVIQDADLEYDRQELNLLHQLILDDKAGCCLWVP